MKRMSKTILWISIGIALALAIGLIILCTRTDGNWTKIVIVLCAIDFIYLTMAVQIAAYRTFRYNPKKIKYPTKEFKGEYETLAEVLRKNGFRQRKTDYGNSFIKVEDTTALKCVLIDDPGVFFTPKEEEVKDEKGSEDLKKCKVFVGIEIFSMIDEENRIKLPDFSFQGKNIYYTALLKEEDHLVCLNYLEPDEAFQQGYHRLLDILGLEEVSQEKQ